MQSFGAAERRLVRELLTPHGLVVLRGDRGKGKSIFARHFFESSLRQLDYFRNHIVIRIDAKSFLSLQYAFDAERFARAIGPFLEARLWKEVSQYPEEREQLIEFLRLERGYQPTPLEGGTRQYGNDEIAKWVSSEWPGDPLRLSVLLMAFLSGKGPTVRPLILVFDNVDQFPFQTQVEMLRFVYILAREAEARAVLIMRRVTQDLLWQARNSSLQKLVNAYGADVFSYIDHEPPSLAQILKRRVEVMSESISEYLDIPAHGKRFVMRADRIWSTIKSTLSETEISKILEKLTGGDIKASMMFALTYFQSAFLDWELFAESIVRSWVDESVSPSNQLSADQFLRCIILNNKKMYSGETGQSLIVNLFSCRTVTESYSSIVRFYTLRLVAHYGGRLKGALIVKQLSTLGFSGEAVCEALERFRTHRLIEEYPILGPRGEDHNRYSIEEVSLEIRDNGHYYVEELCNRFEYIQHMVDDSFLFRDLTYEYDPNAFENFEARLSNALLLVRQVYLDDFDFRLNLLRRSAIEYDKAVAFMGADLISLAMLEEMETFVSRNLSTAFGTKHNLIMWHERIIRLRKNIERANRQLTMLLDEA